MMAKMDWAAWYRQHGTPIQPACRRRHWYAYYGMPGTSSPTCRRCGAPNLRYDPDRDPERPV